MEIENEYWTLGSRSSFSESEDEEIVVNSRKLSRYCTDVLEDQSYSNLDRQGWSRGGPDEKSNLNTSSDAHTRVNGHILENNWHEVAECQDHDAIFEDSSEDDEDDEIIFTRQDTVREALSDHMEIDAVVATGVISENKSNYSDGNSPLEPLYAGVDNTNEQMTNKNSRNHPTMGTTNISPIKTIEIGNFRATESIACLYSEDEEWPSDSHSDGEDEKENNTHFSPFFSEEERTANLFNKTKSETVPSARESLKRALQDLNIRRENEDTRKGENASNNLYEESLYDDFVEDDDLASYYHFPTNADEGEMLTTQNTLLNSRSTYEEKKIVQRLMKRGLWKRKKKESKSEETIKEQSSIAWSNEYTEITNNGRWTAPRNAGLANGKSCLRNGDEIYTIDQFAEFV